MIRRFKQRIDHGDVIESPKGEFVLFKDVEGAIRAFEASQSTVSYRCLECGAFHLKRPDQVSGNGR